MAPRALESLDDFIKRLKRDAAAGRTEIRFGGHHYTHAACDEQGTWRVRRLEYTQAEADEYLAKHNYFMPESAEAISKPRTLVFEAASLDALIKKLKSVSWPM